MCALAQGVSTPAIAMFTADSITTLTAVDADEEHMLGQMAPTLYKIMGLAVVQFLLAFAWQTCLSWAAAKQCNRWHASFMGTLLSLDVSWYDEHEPAGVAAKLETGIGNVYSFMSTALGYLIASLAQLIGGLALAFVTGWQLALVVSATIPVLMCLAHRLGKEVERQTVDQQRDFARASAVAEESLMAIRTVAAFGGEGTELGRFEKELLSAKMGGVRSGAKIGVAWGGLNFFYAWVYGLALWCGGHVLLANESFHYQPNQVVTVMIAMLVGVTGLSSFSGFAPMMAKAVVSAKSMKQVGATTVITSWKRTNAFSFVCFCVSLSYHLYESSTPLAVAYARARIYTSSRVLNIWMVERVLIFLPVLHLAVKWPGAAVSAAPPGYGHCTGHRAPALHEGRTSGAA